MKARLPSWTGGPWHHYLAWVPALVSILFLALVVIAVEWVVGSALTRRSSDRVEQTARLHADQLARVMEQRVAELRLLAGDPAVSRLDDRTQVRGELQRLKDSNASYAWIGVLTAEGTVLAASDGLLEGLSIADRPVFVEGRRQLWVGDLHPPRVLVPAMRAIGLRPPERLADVALPLRDPAGGVHGVLAAHLDASYFEQLRETALGDPDPQARRTLELVVVSARGEALLGALPALAPAEWHAWLDRTGRRAEDLSGVDGDPLMMARSPVATDGFAVPLDWHVVASQRLDAALQPLRLLERDLVFGGGLAALLLGGSGFWVSRRLVRPYANLLDAVAQRLHDDPASAAGSAGYLEALTEQAKRLPPADRPELPAGEQLLARVLHDAGRFASMLDQLPAPVYLLDADRRVLYWNRACERVFGWRADEAVGQPVAALLSLDVPTAPGAGEEVEGRARHKNGSSVRGQWRLTDLHTTSMHGAGVLVQVHDLTAERAAEERLHQQRETLAAVIHSASDAVISTAADGRIQLFNPAAERIFGRSARTMLGEPLALLLPERFRARHSDDLRGFGDSKVTRRAMGAGRVKGLRADGQELELEASISQVTVGEEKTLTAILRDVTDRVRAEEELAQYRRELSQLTQQLMAQEKTMTRRIAQALHDRLGQTLTAIRLNLDALAATAQVDPPMQARLAQLVDAAIQEVRQVLVELRPPLLDEHGLAEALDNELRSRRTTPVVARLEVDPVGAALRWMPDVEYAAFMIAREALANALLHSGASRIDVTLDGTPQHLLLRVTDNGRGLEDGAAAGRPGHLGIVGMRERAAAIGARMDVRSTVGAGTAVVLSWKAAP